MTTIVDLQENLLKFKPAEAVVKAFEKNKAVASKLNAGQMNRGENAGGSKIGTYKAPDGKYARAKHSNNSLPGKGFVDLRFTKDFYKGIHTKLTGQEFEINSSDWKSDMLEDRYKKNGSIFGLQESSKEILASHLQVDVLKELENITGLKPTDIEKPLALPQSATLVESLIKG